MQEELIIKMSISKKIKAIDNKVKQNKGQYDLDRQIAKISALSSGNTSKYKFSTGKVVFPEIDLPQKASTVKRFKYSPLSKELKTKTDISKKQYKKSDDTYELDKIIEKGKPMLEKYDRLNLIYDSKYSFYPYYNIKNFNSLSQLSKYAILFSF